ncbi:hypothetical protein F5Y06DRAFT_215091 [Hypoxylon sp. FL0890]|nr:hypothetical protein F5Y06DRAFT_215091 [Hypoxylon sp. FL0890]
MKAIFNSFAFIFPLWLAQSASGSLPKTGNITLFSDINCQEPVYVNSFILGIDTCGKADSATPYLNPFRSFILNERPYCRSGARPSLSIYSDSTCSDLIASNLPNSLVEEETHHPCVAPGDFKGMQFICGDSDGDEDTPGDAPTSAEVTFTEAAPTVFESTPTVFESTPTVTSTAISENISISTAPNTSTGVPSSATSSSVLGSSVSGLSVATASSSNTTSGPSASPVPTSGAATTVDGALVVKLGLCLFFLLITI